MDEDKKIVQNMYFDKLAEDLFIDAEEEISYPPVAISLGEAVTNTTSGEVRYPIPIGTYGNFSFVQAPPKSKKTFFISLLGSIFLSGSNIYGGNIKGHRTDECLVHFDTEQGRFHAQKVFKRVLDMNAGNDVGCYHTFGLRTLGYKERIDFIEYYLYNKLEKKAGVVIIDGIADLVSDVNNLEESNAVVQKIMKWSAELNCHIVTVIHSNFGSDKPTGHLGSFLEKKAETQIQLEVNTVNKELVTVSCKRSRGFPFETFSFKVNNHGLPEVEGDLFDVLEGTNFKKVKYDN